MSQVRRDEQVFAKQARWRRPFRVKRAAHTAWRCDPKRAPDSGVKLLLPRTWHQETAGILSQERLPFQPSTFKCPTFPILTVLLEDHLVQETPGLVRASLPCAASSVRLRVFAVSGNGRLLPCSVSAARAKATPRSSPQPVPGSCARCQPRPSKSRRVE